MSPDDNDQKPGGMNPIVAIVIAISAALILAGVSLILFLRSGIRHSEKLTGSTSEVVADNLSDDPDQTSGIKPDDLDVIEVSIQKSVSGVNSDDYGSSTDMSDASLGL